MITVGSLFSGVGGLEKGLEDTGGFVTKWQVENDDYATRVLTKHWPNVRRWNDVRTFPPMRQTPLGPCWQKSEWEVDLICGGFPCQDISNAGKRAGIEGTRSGLFYEVVRVAGLLRPRMLLLENVAALLHRGMGTVLGELSEIGYDAEWHCVPAASVGAPHIRDRVFIIGYLVPDTRGRDLGESAQRRIADTKRTSDRQTVADAASDGIRTQRNQQPKSREQPSRWDDAFGRSLANGIREAANSGRWATEPAICFVADGLSPDVVRYAGRTAHNVPNRVAKLRCLGNAVVPMVAQVIGQAILDSRH